MTEQARGHWLTKFVILAVLLSLTSITTGCTLNRPSPIPPNSPTPTTPNSPISSFAYQVRVQTESTNNHIRRAHVTIEVRGKAPLDDFTDVNGLARLFIPTEYVNQPGVLLVEASGYQRHRQHIDLIKDTLPDVVQLEASPTPLPPKVSNIAISPTNTPTPSPTPTNTPTYTPTPTSTNTVTPTNTPIPTPTYTVTHTPTPIPNIHFIDKDINFRKGPGTNYPIIGFLSVGTEVEILGRNNTGNWFFVSLETSSKGWISDLAFRESIVLASVPVQTSPPTPTFTPTPILISAPILIAPENAAKIDETRPDLIWIWDEDITQDDNFYFEVKTWLNDKKDPIDVAWVRYPCYRYDEVIEGGEGQVWEFRWNVIVVKGIPGEPKQWSPVESCGQWPSVSVWNPGLITQTITISEISEKRLIKVIIGSSAIPGVPPGGKDDDDGDDGPSRN